MKLSVSRIEGRNATAYMSPTEVFIWSASTIRMVEGGRICASVPEAMMVPDAMRRS